MKKKMLERIYKNPNIEIIGWTDNISKYLAQSVVSISPFAVPHFSRLVLESFALKKPAIASNVEGMDEIIEHGVDGLLFQNNDPKSLADSINYLCSHPSVAKEMGNAGYVKYKKRYSCDNIVKVESILQTIFSGNN